MAEGTTSPAQVAQGPVEKGYKFPEKVVTTEWVAQHLDDPRVRLIECNEDVLLYERGHIPGAVHVDWVGDLNDPVVRDYLNREQFEQLMSRIGATNDTRLIFYGDKNNWWACYALWVFELFGHFNTAVLDGGRAKWQEEGRPLTREVPQYAPTHYRGRERADYKIRAFRDDVAAHIRARRQLVDVRSPAEYTGEAFHMEGYPQEGSVRTGHIRGAINVPWAQAANPDGTFKTAAELQALYEGAGLHRIENIITYCRIGERSSHTWFVLQYLLGFPIVRNYDGSWTEWGNLVGAPIEKGPQPESRSQLHGSPGQD